MEPDKTHSWTVPGLKISSTLPNPILYIVLPLIFLLGIGFYLVKSETISPPQNVTISNVTESSATISWTTPSSVKGLVVVSADSRFPLVPMLAPSASRDAREKNWMPTTAYSIHYVNISNLEPRKVYKYKIYQGFKEVYSGSLATGSKLEPRFSKENVSGQLLRADKATPYPNALVYVRMFDGPKKSQWVSTLADAQGFWSVNILGFRDPDFGRFYELGDKSAAEVVVDSNEGKFTANMVPSKSSNWPNIILASN